mmetsp:Transcript_25698/g.22717  ORF Transcript_25698/g.22717 Transcript_25698/m.22717 type:complete len:84 (-) Transcript_25698:164-415(-)|eukprot:CAMPEP_0114587090 /NCGR_PEP_ID=MMETSP0125-20121206/10139_1 /TAXON_ID=485358 ORGANISM="Aristerostoma sp., Strain ATCC 50986" /NCGR_SAMPLE_ID=MMETSP0125 /ASSEMBLY_ACC=CAM_ASM_000245 /LENGTH=83 /DNA_ID=CAMNT_0001782831 /DNA_START=689 /DNA_END=940 /DNA_ORIENTATION=-
MISFKLETDRSIFEEKIKGSFTKYAVDMVVGNILETRRKEVFLYYRFESTDELKMNHIEIKNDDQLVEEPLIDQIDIILKSKK